jgi:hypothetical protein
MVPRIVVKIRVLQLESWMRYIGLPEDFLHMPGLEDYKPPFWFPIKRDGYYCVTFDRWHTDCWIQVRGKAYRYQSKYFMYSLSIMSAAERDRTIPDDRKLSWAEREAARLAFEARSLRNSSREMRLLFLKR